MRSRILRNEAEHGSLLYRFEAGLRKEVRALFAHEYRVIMCCPDLSKLALQVRISLRTQSYSPQLSFPIKVEL